MPHNNPEATVDAVLSKEYTRCTRAARKSHQQELVQLHRKEVA